MNLFRRDLKPKTHATRRNRTPKPEPAGTENATRSQLSDVSSYRFFLPLNKTASRTTMNANQTAYIVKTSFVVVSGSNNISESLFQKIGLLPASELDLRLILVELVDDKAVERRREKGHQHDAKENQRRIVNFKHLLLPVG
jgi:hypothetical protein